MDSCGCTAFMGDLQKYSICIVGASGYPFILQKRKREKSKERYPQFFSMHALSFAAGEKQEGRKTMEEYFEKIKHQMLRFIRNDEKIRSHIFTERLSKEVSGGCFVWMELFKCT